MLGLCWAICSLCGADGRSFGGLYGVPLQFLESKNISNENFSFGIFFRARKNPNEKKNRWDLFGVLIRGYIGPFWAVLGLCWARVGSFGGLFGVPWKFLEGKNNPQHKAFCVEGYLGRLFWAHVGSFGELYGVPWGLWREKITPNTNLFVLRVILGDFFGTMLGQCWAVLGPCWANVGSSGGLSGVPWGGNLQPKTFRLRVFLAHFLPSRDFLEPSCHI